MMTVKESELKFDQLESRIDRLTNDVKRIDRPPKDNWDKASIIASLLSGVVIAGVIAIFTVFYQMHESANRKATAEQNYRILKAQTIPEFLPYLASKNPEIRDMAIRGLSFIDDDGRLFVESLNLFRDDDRTIALGSLRDSDKEKIQAEFARKKVDIFTEAISSIMSNPDGSKSLPRTQVKKMVLYFFVDKGLFPHVVRAENWQSLLIRDLNIDHPPLPSDPHFEKKNSPSNSRICSSISTSPLILHCRS